VFAALVAAQALAAQQAPPSPAEVLGHQLGERFTPYAGVQRYSQALAQASERVDYRPYGRTPEGRELFQLVIAAPQNLQALPRILAANAELTRPETPAQRAAQIAATNPAVIYFSYGVHGNETSSSEAALYTACWIRWWSSSTPSPTRTAATATCSGSSPSRARGPT
jgi:hypothetical protein